MGKTNHLKLFVLGFFGYASNQLDGQTVKTRSLHAFLEKNLNSNVPFFDTEVLKKNKKAFFSGLFQLVRAKHIIYLPAGNNLKKFFPVLFVLSKFFNFKIHYFVIGGWLPKLMETNISLRNKLKKVTHIYVETERMKEILESKFSFKNISVFPNFRDDKPSKTTISDSESNSGLKIVFMSRINKMKGIETVFEYAAIAPKTVSIDFYGPIKTEDHDFFMKQVAQHPNVNYKGVLQLSEISEFLSAYDVMVLPTRYYTEGLPGAIVDAYFAGIPVIVTEWMNAREFVKDGETGFIIPFENGFKEFNENLNLLSENHEILNRMKQKSLDFAKEFTSENAWEILKDKLD